MLDCLVIGGGPVGLYTAGLVARAGYSVAVVEEHDSIGMPVQCSGIVSPRVLDFVPSTGNSVQSGKKGARVIAGRAQISFKAPDQRAVVIDRTLFDKAVMHWSADAGVDIRLGTRLAGVSDGHPVVSSKGAREVMKAWVIVGADGPSSPTARYYGLDRSGMEVVAGWQVEAALDSVEDMEKVTLWLGSNYAPGFFAWSIPVMERSDGKVIARVGLGAVPSMLKRPLPSYGRQLLHTGDEILSVQGGPIPIGIVKDTVKGNVLLVGDAAAQVKATSGGGLYTGMSAARHAADAIISALENDEPALLRNYEKAWRSTVGDMLARNLKLRRIFLSLNDEQLEHIITTLDRKDLIGIIIDKGDIDHPWKAAWTVLKRAPSLARYIPRALMG